MKRRLAGMMSATKAWILESRLGSCWKCMSFAVGMLLISLAAFVMTVHWRDLESEDFLAGRAAEVALVGVILFGALCVAHAFAVVLKRTVWAGSARVNNRG